MVESNLYTDAPWSLLALTRLAKERRGPEPVALRSRDSVRSPEDSLDALNELRELPDADKGRLKILVMRATIMLSHTGHFVPSGNFDEQGVHNE
jgi:hypothetical protein